MPNCYGALRLAPWPSAVAKGTTALSVFEGGLGSVHAAAIHIFNDGWDPHEQFQ